MTRARRRCAAAVLAAALLAACERDADRLSLEEVQPVPERCDTPPPPDGVATVQVVFSCDEVAVGTWRALPADRSDTLRFAFEALLQGPTAEEQENGLVSFFSAETAGMLRGVTVREGVAYVDFYDFSRLIPNASSSAGSQQLLDQIAGTAFQFDAVREAELTFNGGCDAFWNWLQRSCQRLTRGEH